MNITALGTDGGIIEIQEDTGLASITDGYNDTIVFGESEIEDLYDVLDEYVDDDGDGTCVCGNSSCDEEIECAMDVDDDNSGDDDTVVLNDVYDSQVEFVAPKECVIDDGSGGEVVLLGSELERLYEELDDRFDDDGHDNRPVDELDFLNTTVGFTDDGPFDSQLEYERTMEDDGGTCVCGNSSCGVDDAHIYSANDVPGITVTEDGGDVYVPNANVSLNTTVSVEGASDEQKKMYREMASLVEDNYETFVNKNMSYGNSFLNTDVGFTSDGPFDSQLESNANGLLVRMSDKMTRLENILLSGGEDRVGEKAVETALDLANYANMLGYLVQEKGGEN